MAEVKYEFFTQLAEFFNSDQSRSVILSGNVYDLFFNGQEYVPLIPFVAEKSATDGLIRLVYELNGPIRILDAKDKLKNAWIAWKSGVDTDTLLIRGMKSRGESEFEQLAKQFDRLLLDAIGNPTLALEALRQFSICSRSHLSANLLILIEAADMLIPAGNGDVASLNDKQLHRIGVVQDWFSDPAFMNDGDSVILFAESRSLIHPRIARLPQVLNVEVPSPNLAERLHFAQHYIEHAQYKPKLWGTPEDLASFSAGLSVHALRQLLLRASYTRDTLTPTDLVGKVQEFIQSQLGEDVVEFQEAVAHVRRGVWQSEAQAIPAARVVAAFSSFARQGAGRGGGGRPDRRRQDLHLRSGRQRTGRARAGAQEHPQSMVRSDRRDLRATAARLGGAWKRSSSLSTKPTRSLVGLARKAIPPNGG